MIFLAQAPNVGGLWFKDKCILQLSAGIELSFTTVLCG
jgi:hypothetical protein